MWHRVAGEESQSCQSSVAGKESSGFFRQSSDGMTSWLHYSPWACWLHYSPWAWPIQAQHSLEQSVSNTSLPPLHFTCMADRGSTGRDIPDPPDRIANRRRLRPCPAGTCWSSSAWARRQGQVVQKTTELTWDILLAQEARSKPIMKSSDVHNGKDYSLQQTVERQKSLHFEDRTAPQLWPCEWCLARSNPTSSTAIFRKMKMWLLSPENAQVTHPVVIGDSKVDLEDLPGLVGFQDIPATVGGAVDDWVVVTALPNPSAVKHGRARQGKARQGRAGQGKLKRSFVLVFSTPRSALHNSSMQFSPHSTRGLWTAATELKYSRRFDMSN